ncbi:MAG: hypothetical protein [Bacteriophage sp.]|nr:MAG: hypothetical protein [Bacteriophage sp.]
MSTTQHTGHYNLPTFGDNPNDRPSWRGDFTDAMTKIDNQMYANATNTTTATAAANNATAAANNAKKAADAATELAQANKSNIAKQESYFNALGVTSVPTAQNLMSTINGKAENTALTALQGKVSTLSDTVSGKANAVDVYTKAQSDTTFTKQGGYAGTAKTLNDRISANTSSISTVNSSLDSLRKNGVAPVKVYHSTDDVYGAKIEYTAYYSPLIKLVMVNVVVTGSSTNWAPGWNGAEGDPMPQQYRPTRDIRQLLDVFVGAGHTMPAHLLFGINTPGIPYVVQTGPDTTTQSNLNISGSVSYFISD